METIFAAICAAALGGNLNVSDNLAIACFKDEMPALTQSGEFSRRGIGAELAVFAANAEYISTLDIGEEVAQAETDSETETE